MPTAVNLPAVDAATLCLVNAARHDAGVPALVENARLDRAAVGHSAEMVGAGYFDHVGPDGRDAEARILATGYVPTGRGGVGENIGAATRSAATPAAIVASWMRSPDHRVNILSPHFRVTGLGVAAGAPALLGNQPGATYTEEFA